jgi:hypothetical protein
VCRIVPRILLLFPREVECKVESVSFFFLLKEGIELNVTASVSQMKYVENTEYIVEITRYKMPH